MVNVLPLQTPAARSSESTVCDSTRQLPGNATLSCEMVPLVVSLFE